MFLSRHIDGFLFDKILKMYYIINQEFIVGRRNIDSCLSKTSYETYEDALATLNYVYETEGIKLKIYKCPICGNYHLTKGKK